MKTDHDLGKKSAFGLLALIISFNLKSMNTLILCFT